MNKKKSIMIGIVLLTAAMISGVSFALWQMTLTTDSTNTITTGCFRVTFEEQNPISLENAYPISKEEGKSLTPYTFTITNTCDSYASYQINLEILENTTFNNLDYFNTMLDDIVFSLKEKGTVPTTLSNATTAKKLETGYLDANQSKTFELRLWLDENTPATKEYMNQIFNSKVTIIATHQTEFDKESPTTNIEVTNLTNLIHVDASASGDNTNVKYYYYSLDGESFVKTKEPEYTFEVGELNYGVATDTIKTLADSLSEEYTVYVKTEDEYGNISEVVTKKVYKDFAYDNTTDNNLRYIGASPNNYVSFNNELWRIIGVMENIDDGTGKKDARIKLIRDESIGAYSWDSSDVSINEGHGINEWSQADLMKLMNPGYENEGVGGSLYWNSKMGICYTGYMNGTSSCDFTTKGLSANAKEYIETVIWNTGSKGTINYNQILTNHYYTLERGSYIGKNCYGTSHCNDSVTRTTSWIGKVGLLYPSDFGFATNGGVTLDRNQCLNSVLYIWSENNLDDCKNNNWLFNSSGSQWTMTSNGDIDTAFGVIRIFEIGQVSGGGNAFDLSFVNPVVYLRADIKMVDGNGTKKQPFQFSL